MLKRVRTTNFAKSLLGSKKIKKVDFANAYPYCDPLRNIVHEKLFCSTCGGRGYNAKGLCSSCMGSGVRAYTYF